MDKLDSARIKLEGADEHLETFNMEFGTWLALNPYKAIREKDEQLGLDVLRLKIVDMPRPPDRLGRRIADYVQNLRDSLDHIIYSLLPSRPPRPRDIKFPVFTDSAKYPRAASKSIGLLPAPVQAEVERLQPYHAGQGVMSHPLIVLDDLANASKHREVAIVVHSFMYSFAGPNPNERVALTFQFSEKMQDDPKMPLLPFAEQAAISFDFKIEPTFAIVYQDRDGTRNHLLPVQALGSLYDHIRDKVFPAFEPFA